MKKTLLFLLLITGCSNAEDSARNDEWRITPPPTAEEMSHYRIVQNESKTAYAVQSTNTSWVDEKAWWQLGNTWNTLRECTNDMHRDIGDWRKRKNPEKWNEISSIPIACGVATNTPTRWQYQEIRDQQEKIERQIKAAEAFGKTNTDRRFSMLVEAPNMFFSHKLTTNDIELGYRSDGTVIWRIPPEAKEENTK